MVSDKARAFRAIREVCGAETCSPQTPQETVTQVNHRLRQILAAFVLMHMGKPCTCDHGPHRDHHEKCLAGRIQDILGAQFS